MAWTLFILAVIAAVANWVAVEREWQRIEYITKPVVILALIAWLRLLAAWNGPLVWFGLALCFSLAGDIFLLLPDQFFLAGLGAFLLVHVAYIVGLNLAFPPINLGSLVLLISGVLLIALIYPKIRAGLLTKPGGKILRPAVFCYSVALTAMLLSAVLTLFRLNWNRSAALVVAAGGILFYISDTLLGFDRFVGPVRHARLLVIVTYHLAQIALVSGALLQFGG
jgi:uncharacterized membrane protein YhhN